MIVRGVIAAAAIAAPAAAQHQHHHEPAPPPAAAPSPGARPAMDANASPAPPAAGSPPSGDPQPEAAPAIGTAPPPAAPSDKAADRVYAPDRMAAARKLLAKEHGGATYYLLIADIAEWQLRNGHDAYRWEGEGWWGGDLNRLVVKTEGEGSRGRSPDDAEVQALYSRAIDPYWNLQAGIRQDVSGPARRTWATAAMEGLAPYWFELEGSLFLSNRGEVAGRISAYYDQRITQALVLQPRVEFNLAAQSSDGLRQGSGLVSSDLDLRLRYEFVREFAPYVGVSHSRLSGRTARLARATGDDARSTAVVVGIRAWF